MKLKKLNLELADDFTNVQLRKGRHKVYQKRWRVWCNGVCLGDIIKYSDGTFKLNIYKCDIGDVYHYVKEGTKYKFNPKAKDPRNFGGYKTLEEAKKAFVATFKSNLKHFIEGY